MDRAIEVRDLAAQIIDPFGRCDRAREDGALDLFDVGFKVGDDRALVLDHVVQDCPEHRVSAKGDQFGCCSSRVRAPCSSLATPCRTVSTKLGPTKMLIS